MVLEKSNSTLGAIVLGLPEVTGSKARPEPGHGKHFQRGPSELRSAAWSKHF